MENINQITLLSKEKVINMTSLSYPTIWRMMKKGTFPQSVSASNRRVAWIAKDIEQWLSERA